MDMEADVASVSSCDIPHIYLLSSFAFHVYCYAPSRPLPHLSSEFVPLTVQKPQSIHSNSSWGMFVLSITAFGMWRGLHPHSLFPLIDPPFSPHHVYFTHIFIFFSCCFL